MRGAFRGLIKPTSVCLIDPGNFFWKSTKSGSEDTTQQKQKEMIVRSVVIEAASMWSLLYSFDWLITRTLYYIFLRSPITPCSQCKFVRDVAESFRRSASNNKPLLTTVWRSFRVFCHCFGTHWCDCYRLFTLFD